MSTSARPIETLTQYIDQIGPNRARFADVRAFRGHSGSGLPLSPSVFRTDHFSRNENSILRELLSSHPEEFEKDQTTLEQLVRVQHYSLPTRLLDITWNPLVALYFACQAKTERKVPQDGEVFTIITPREKVSFYDSDTVSCLANLANLTSDLRNKIVTTIPQADFNRELPIRRLLHFIRQEKYQFEPEIVPTDLNRILMIKPKKSNKRIIAQAGAFMIFGLKTTLPDPSSDGFEIATLKIPHDSKSSLLRELDDLAINQSTLFPEIERTASYIKDGLPRRLWLSLKKPPVT